MVDAVSGLCLSELSLRLNHVKEVTSRDQLHDNVVASSILQELVDSRDMWVDGLFENLELVFVQLLVDVCDLETFLFNDFDSAGHLGLPVHAELDRAKGPRAKFFADRVKSSEVSDHLKAAVLLEGKEVLGLLLSLCLSQSSLRSDHLVWVEVHLAFKLA